MPLDIDRNLIQTARSGGTALERLIAAVWPEAYRLAFSILRDAGLAEDAAQEACVAMARSLPELKSDDAFRSWIYKIVVNHAIAGVRRRPPTQPLETLAERGASFDCSDAVDLSNALGALPPVQRATILLHYYVGFNSGEIAAATGLPSSTVRFHLMLARRALRKALIATNSNLLQPSKEVLSNVR